MKSTVRSFHFILLSILSFYSALEKRQIESEWTKAKALVLASIFDSEHNLILAVVTNPNSKIKFYFAAIINDNSVGANFIIVLSCLKEGNLFNLIFWF